MRSAFTLLELLVVIGIIGMLAAFSLPNFMAARERARDSQRKSDLKQIQKALELFKLDQSLPEYPAGLPAVDTEWVAGTNIYMKRMPGDPSSGTGYPYANQRLPSDTNTYYLCACLENRADPEPTPEFFASCVCSANTKPYGISEP